MYCLFEILKNQSILHCRQVHTLSKISCLIKMLNLNNFIQTYLRYVSLIFCSEIEYTSCLTSFRPTGNAYPLVTSLLTECLQITRHRFPYIMIQPLLSVLSIVSRCSEKSFRNNQLSRNRTFLLEIKLYFKIVD